MFVVIELQTSQNVTTPLTSVYSDQNAAEQKFHEILSYAAVSNVGVHAAAILTESGEILKSEFYVHPETSN